MKHTTFLTISLFSLLGTSGAHATSSAHIHANTISAHNVATIQHTITQTAFSSFAGSMRGTMGAQKSRSKSIDAQRNEDPKTTYGRAPMYGTAPMYGEFNEDGTMGRSGGDSDTQFAALSNIWLNWQHTNSDIKFNNIAPTSNKNDLIRHGIISL